MNSLFFRMPPKKMVILLSSLFTLAFIFIVQSPTGHCAPPILSNGFVSPDSGGVQTLFTYRVDYTDIDGDLPSVARVIIDTLPYDMTPQPGSDPKDGITYIYETDGVDLGVGDHIYLFIFENSAGETAVLPAWLWFDGPSVIPEPDISISPLTLNFPISNEPIFVEIDWMEDTIHSHKPSQDVINRIIQTFAIEGFTINIEISNPIPHQDVLNIEGGTPSTSPDIQSIRDQHFDNISDNRYYYSIWAHEWGTDGNPSNRSGIADLPGRIHLVTLGSFPGGVGTEDHQVGTFIHELGHNLGQRHGGADDANYKPNYISIMNYFYQLFGIGPRLVDLDLADSANGFNDFGYSHGTLGDLDENQLDETVGIGLGKAVDWNCNGLFTDTGVSQDIQVADGNWCAGSGGLAVLSDFDNWIDLRNYIRTAASTLGTMSVQDSPAEKCISWEESQDIQARIDERKQTSLDSLESNHRFDLRTQHTGTPLRLKDQFIISNDGTDDLTITAMEKQNGSVWLSYDMVPPFDILPGDQKRVTVNVDPSSLSAGQYSDRIIISSNDPNKSPYPDGVHINLSVFCPSDLDNYDGDVDGADLAAYIVDSNGTGVADFATDFGKTNCQ